MINETLIIDLVVWAWCALLLFRHAKLSFFHPAILYLAFHAFVVTWRLVTIVQGSPTMFSDELSTSLGFEPVTLNEITRAALYADVSLIAATLGCFRATKSIKPAEQNQDPDEIPLNSLSEKILLAVSILTLFIGILGLILFSDELPFGLPAMGKTTTIGYFSITQTWMGLSAVGLIYWYGFRPGLVFILTAYILIVVFQANFRVLILAPTLLAIQIYLQRRHMKWPNFRMTLAIMVIGILILPAKEIGRQLQQHSSASTIFTATVDHLDTTLSGDKDALLLDNFASTLTLVDRSQAFSYGEMYLAVLTLPIPRDIWPSKPDLAGFMDEISTAQRPMGRFGMTPTSYGEAYLNFGFAGIIIIPFLMLFYLSKFYFWAEQKTYFSLVKFSYLLTAANFIQIYRDGLRVIVVFTFVAMMPLVLIVLAHLFIPSDETLWKRLLNGDRIRISSTKYRSLMTRKPVPDEYGGYFLK